MSFSLRASALAVLVLVAALPTAAQGQTPGEFQQSQGFRKALTVGGMEEHLRAFQTHSDLNGGTRAGGSPGFEASATYVADRARAAGYTVSDHFFTFTYNADRTPPTLRQTAPTSTEYVDGVDFSSMTFSGSVAETTARVWAVDLVLPQGDTTSGCEGSDFAGMPAGAIALMQRGTCGFGVKADNARAAGAIGSIIFNDGGTGPGDRVGMISGTLGPGTHGPAVGTTLALGQDLANGVVNGDTGSTVTYKVDRVEEQRTTRNVIAEKAGEGASAEDVLVVGAHLDSVPRGAGINDNGSGSAGILEIAETMAGRDFAPRNTVRFMWYSAEEFGLLGSQAYVNGLSQAERDRIEAMLNFDMIGSPNYVRFVYDGDNSAFPVGPGAAKGPEGSGEIERIFHDYFASQRLASDETPFSGRSDYGPFIAAGVDIPAGGLFTGAEGIKTAQQAAVYGGTAGVAYDKCYHLRCDTLANVNRTGLDQMGDAAGHTAFTLAKRDFVRSPLVNPSGPVSGSGGTNDAGGGLHPAHDHEEDSE